MVATVIFKSTLYEQSLFKVTYLAQQRADSEETARRCVYYSHINFSGQRFKMILYIEYTHILPLNYGKSHQ